MWKFLLLILLLHGRECLSQVPFAQANQFPLLFNPSLAGAKDKRRIALAWNRVASKNNNSSNYGLSYDQPLKGLGAGIGCYALLSQRTKEPLAGEYISSLPSSLMNGGYALKGTDLLVGLAFAPKYNFWDKRNPNVIKYTFSPSAFLEYENTQASHLFDFERKSYFTTHYAIQHPNGAVVLDSSTTTWITNQNQGRKVRAGIGLLVNAKNVLILLKTAYEMNILREEVIRYSYDFPRAETSNRHVIYSPRLHAIVQSANVGISIPQNPSAKLYFTPLAGYGYKLYLNPPHLGENPPAQIYWQKIYRNNFAHYVHLSANFRAGNMLWGASFTRNGQQDCYGLGIGLQRSWLKLMIPLYFAQDYAFMEASVNLFFQ